jgi:hypothetical protein
MNPKKCLTLDDWSVTAFHQRGKWSFSNHAILLRQSYFFQNNRSKALTRNPWVFVSLRKVLLPNRENGSTTIKWWLLSYVSKFINSCFCSKLKVLFVNKMKEQIKTRTYFSNKSRMKNALLSPKSFGPTIVWSNY